MKSKKRKKNYLCASFIAVFIELFWDVIQWIQLSDAAGVAVSVITISFNAKKLHSNQKSKLRDEFVAPCVFGS